MGRLKISVTERTGAAAALSVTSSPELDLLPVRLLKLVAAALMRRIRFMVAPADRFTEQGSFQISFPFASGGLGGSPGGLGGSPALQER